MNKVNAAKRCICISFIVLAAAGVDAAVQILSASERDDIIDAAITESKQYFERQQVLMAEAEKSDTYPEKVTLYHIKKPSELAKKHAKARLQYEDMVRRAERKLFFSQMGTLATSNIENKAEAVAQNLFHVPGSLLTSEELAKMFDVSGCRPLLATPNCTFLTLNLYRTSDGTCNNLAKPIQGASGTAFRRILPAHYEDGISSTRGEIQNYGKILSIGPFDPPNPSPRLISQTIVLDKPVDELQATHMLMQWGQFLDHDITIAPGLAATCVECQNTDVCLPIFVPSDDPAFGVGTFRNGSCLPFRRTVPACSNAPQGQFDPREQINDLTSYIDASMVYGSDPVTAKSLRDTSGGRLRVGFTLSNSTKSSLPLNAAGTGFVAGDTRVNEQAGLMTLHTIFMREHNRIAATLASLNPSWSDERLYQEAREIVGAEIQKITYSEFLPTIMGSNVFNNLIGPYLGYNPNADASIPNEFAAAAYRVGHTLIRPNFPRLQADFVTSIPGGDQPLAFGGQIGIYNNSLGTDPLLRGLLTANARRRDEFLNSILTTKLFEGAAAGSGSDLASLNIQRGRDHGLPPYPIVKNFCKSVYGISSAFEHQLTFIRFLQTYGSLDTADLWVGGISEERLPNSLLGATFACIFANAFSNLRDGDRFFYQAPGVFTAQQLAEINKVSLSRIICDNSDGISQIQPNAFLSNQSRISCSNIPSLDLSKWKEPTCLLSVRINSLAPRVIPYTITSLFPVPNAIYLYPGWSSGCVQIACPTSSVPAQAIIYSSGVLSVSVNPALPANTIDQLSNFIYSAAIPFSAVDSPSSGVTSKGTCSNSTFALTFNVLSAESSVSKSDVAGCDILSPDCRPQNGLPAGVLNALLNQPKPDVQQATPVENVNEEEQLDSWASKDALLKELEDDLHHLISKKA